jgi:transposase-like protein
MKKHRPREIVAKLARADALAAADKTQPEICRELGICVMTLHRWRKRYGAGSASALAAPAPHGLPERLQEENRRLRKLAVDILLEIAAVKEKRPSGANV